MPGALPADHDDDTCGNAGGRAADHRRSELRRPLGMTIAGGLIVSQVLTLYTTPVIDLMLDRLRHRLGGGRAVQTLRDTLHDVRAHDLPASRAMWGTVPEAAMHEHHGPLPRSHDPAAWQMA